MQDRPHCLNLFDFEALAREKLDAIAYDYYRSGAHDEVTLRENRAAFDRIAIHYRVLVDVSGRDTSVELFGRRLAFPVLAAPTAFHRMAHPDGECATARATSAAGTIMILSTLATTAVEEVTAAAAGSPSGEAGGGGAGPVWFQLYAYKDRRVTEGLVRRVERAGCQALVLTVDAPLLGCRERDVRNAFRLPDGLSLTNLLPDGLSDLPPTQTDSGLAAYFTSLINPALTWKDLEWLRSITKLPLLLKGVVRPDDAERAVEHGADGIVVSNHGGRQLDTSPATISVLPRIADAVQGRAEIFVDGGIRRGTDVLKAIALGAKAVLVGRPVLWGLAAGGEAGVRAVLECLRTELDLAMALAGACRTADITRDLVEIPR